jgi:hypothetical protein
MPALPRRDRRASIATPLRPGALRRGTGRATAALRRAPGSTRGLAPGSPRPRSLIMPAPMPTKTQKLKRDRAQPSTLDTAGVDSGGSFRQPQPAGSHLRFGARQPASLKVWTGGIVGRAGPVPSTAGVAPKLRPCVWWRDPSQGGGQARSASR